MSKEVKFFIFLTEMYAQHKGISGQEVLQIFDQYHLTEDIVAMYERYHVERLENAYEDIDEWIAERSKLKTHDWK